MTIAEDHCVTNNQCASTGTCVSDATGAFERCDCDDDYKGPTCSILRSCINNGPCENGATCEEGVNADEFICSNCPDGFIGSNCSVGEFEAIFTLCLFFMLNILFFSRPMLWQQQLV